MKVLNKGDKVICIDASPFKHCKGLWPVPLKEGATYRIEEVTEFFMEEGCYIKVSQDRMLVGSFPLSRFTNSD